MLTLMQLLLPAVVRTFRVWGRRREFAAYVILPVCLLALAAGPVWAASEGQEDLDKAADIKLNAATISDLSEVIRLSESALKKGLDKANIDFANKLLASTLLQRARETTKHLQADVGSPDNFRQKRDFAMSDLEKALKLAPKQAEAYLLIAQLNVLPGGDVKQAREAVDKALELGLDEPPAHAKALLLRADLEEQPEKKMADLNEAVRLVPGDAAAIRARGRLEADLNQLEPALADLNKAIELAPDDGPSYEAEAIVLARLKKYDQALAALDKARQLNPDSVMPLVQRARVHASESKLDDALADLNQALAMDPGNVAVLMLRASVYQEKGEKDKALADVDRVLKLNPDLPLAIRTRALLLAESHRFDEAIGELEKLRKLDPKDTLTLLQLAMLYSVQKKSAKAIEAYTAVLAVDPNAWRALRGRGDAYLNIGRQAEAIADYEKALKLQPKDEGILNNLAWILATSPDAKLRNGPRAIELATLACEVTEYKLRLHPQHAGRRLCRDRRFRSRRQVVDQSRRSRRQRRRNDSLKKELESYKAKKPWRELLTEGKPAPRKARGQTHRKP